MKIQNNFENNKFNNTDYNHIPMNIYLVVIQDNKYIYDTKIYKSGQLGGHQFFGFKA